MATLLKLCSFTIPQFTLYEMGRGTASALPGPCKNDDWKGSVDSAWPSAGLWLGLLSFWVQSRALIYLRASRKVWSRGACGPFEFGSYDQKEYLACGLPCPCPLPWVIMPLSPALEHRPSQDKCQEPFCYLLSVKLCWPSVCPLVFMAEATL